MNRLGVTRVRHALMRLWRISISSRKLSACVRITLATPLRVRLFTILKLGKGKDMKCAGCGRGVGNDSIEAKFLFMRHELECLEAIHANELASL